MKYAPKFVNNILKKIYSENKLLNKFRFYYFNNFIKPDFRIFFKSGLCHVHFQNGIRLKFYDNPIEDILHVSKGYFGKYKAKEGDVVVDAGAYLGVFALYASRIVGDKGKVLAFEPDKSNFTKLARNIELNNAKNIVMFDKGLWDRNETLDVDCRGEGSIAVKCKSGRIKGRVNKCDFITLDYILKKMEIDKVDFIKMDIEGAEIEAILGCINTLKNNKVSLAVASYHVRDGENTSKKMESFFSGIGYASVTDYPKHLTTYASSKMSE